ncbi:type I-E CRISPR-associated protein Cse1/CasA [Rhizobium paknamense]|uniref:CRISPR system Cascade subunit CasA n=1 Tax=Rhizobium paknamense TaxID=1206817 RepID=A0ABU0IBV6_9HYPH|nr:type I-E CRISPR-associated protein Cse1/CasA [Rhizobium paknamense]MDQ0455718.1 CRISPR system Cascade subunit CasA [Rhizobium paknamense]
MSVFNLLRDPWIPVVTACGRMREIAPAGLTEGIGGDAIVDLAWPRADFRAAGMEFLVGLLTTVFCPEGNSAWARWWNAPPSPQVLAEGFAAFERAFDLDGEGPRFLQDGGDLGTETSPVSGLLIEQPGANTEKNNADLFVKRGGVTVLSRKAAAIALYALQSFAPSGGAGHRTGLRGGGPLTTLVLPPQADAGRQTLWHLLWLNVVPLFDMDAVGAPLDKPQKTFPWLGPTRISDKGGVETTFNDMHPAQCFWGMPRRIRLDFEPNRDGLPCALTGIVDDVILRSYRTRPYGVNYQAVPHPLTPFYRVKPGSEPLPVHPQPGSISYRNWPNFTQSRADGTREPAQCVRVAGARIKGQTRLRLCGYDMDNMKARGFVEAEMPLFFCSSQQKQTRLEGLVAALVEAASEVSRLMLSQMKAARGGDGAELDVIRESFWAETEGAFFALLASAVARFEARHEAEEDTETAASLASEWLENTLRPAALAIFDRHVRADAVMVNANDLNAMRALVLARSLLASALHGAGPSGKSLYKSLGLMAPEPKRTAKGGRK